MPVPIQLRTERLLLRAWQPDDAAALLPVLEANYAHNAPWIPAHVATPAPVPELAARLAGFAREFDIAHKWRWGVFLPNGGGVAGEVGLFPRNAEDRVPYDGDADRVEIGYWLRSDLTGRGLATEAARAALGLGLALHKVESVEIRCDARNAPSAAIPRRLGFSLSATIDEPPAAPGEPPVALQVWTYPRPSNGAALV